MRASLPAPLLAALLIELMGCGDGAVDAPLPSETLVVRPAQVSTLALTTETYPLSADLAGAPLFVAADETVRLVGGPAGLFEIGTDGFVLVDQLAVTGMATLADVGVAVGTPNGVSLFTGDLLPTPLTDDLSTMSVQALTARGEELWLAAGTEVYRLAEDVLSAFSELGQTVSLQTYADATLVVLVNAQGQNTLLRDDGESFSLQAIDDEILADDVRVAAGGRLFAIAGGRLMERVDLDDASGPLAVWRPVALTADPADAGATVEAMATDPTRGSLWVVADGTLARIGPQGIEHQTRPAGMGPVQTLTVTADGALWIADDVNLYRVGYPGTPLTWDRNLAAFSAQNCERCHTALGTARPLDTYEAWVNDIDAILDALDTGRMPLDQAPLVGGSVETVRRWQQDGLLR